jgi:hypothetical protein
VEHSAPELVREAGLRVEIDQYVRQGLYPSRVLVARNGAPHHRNGR